MTPTSLQTVVYLITQTWKYRGPRKLYRGCETQATRGQDDRGGEGGGREGGEEGGEEVCVCVEGGEEGGREGGGGGRGGGVRTRC